MGKFIIHQTLPISFLRWMLFNAFCNKYNSGDKQGVIDFAKEHGQSIWANPITREIALQVSIVECVGNGANDAPPHPEVKYASEVLRQAFGLDHQIICHQMCRKSKQVYCVKVTPKDFSPPVTPIMSLYRILYQVRCNLFHGDKVDLDIFQMDRDKFLVSRGTNLMDISLAFISGLPAV
jgi:hypothetical protein